RRGPARAWVLLAGAALLPFDGPARPPREILKPGELREPSGLAFHPGRGTIFAVGDEGDVVELTLEGAVLRRRRVEKKLDLEAVTIGPEGRVCCAIEGAPAILVLDPETLATVRRIDIDPELDGRRVLCLEPNAGVEGLCWVPERRAFFAVNQKSPARLVELELSADGAKARVKRIVAELDGTVKRCSDLAWDAASGHFLIASAHKQKERPRRAAAGPKPEGAPATGGSGGRLFELDADGKVLREVPLPGEKPEGFCLDAAGAAYIACDAGGILKVERAAAAK
ncbi:MAG TPA: SdiA-regulated domain-containing protein, partial [Planctomycetota bacterium]|nr:SdiA-regulated domain-containing protein [Planctomycetota bacterium]